VNAGRSEATRVLGVDMGGSATRAHLTDGSSFARTWSAAGGNLALDPQGASEVLLRLVAEAAPRSVCIGVAGARTAPAAAARLTRELERLVPLVRLMGDAELALAAAFGAHAEGIVVCAGTGSVAVVRERGRMHVLGGHGYLLDDAGSAYDIGRRLVVAALRDRDRGGRELSDRVERVLGEPMDEFVRRVHGEPRDRQLLAVLAQRLPDVDHDAVDVILAEAADALASLAELARQRFGPLPVRLTGGVFLLPRIAEVLRVRCDAQLAETPPEVAAARVAAEAIA
jgi:N-acetylglucosamine kinase-like BadF-type ATPase